MLSDNYYSHSDNLAEFLGDLSISLVFTSPPANALYSLGRRLNGNLEVGECSIPQPSGLAVEETGKVIIAAGSQIIKFARLFKDPCHPAMPKSFYYLPREVKLGYLFFHFSQYE